MGEEGKRLIDTEELKRRHEARRMEVARDPSQRRHVQRAKVRILRNYLKELEGGGSIGYFESKRRLPAKQRSHRSGDRSGCRRL